MSQPFVGEIRMFGGNFAPAGWMFCEGQLLAISDNDTLFTLIGRPMRRRANHVCLTRLARQDSSPPG